MTRRNRWQITVVLLAAIATAPTAVAKYEWKLVAPAGSGCFPPKCSPGQFPMAVLPVAGFDDRLFAIGDRGVWTSADGTTWADDAKTDWGERYGMRFAYFRGQLWMLGGMRSWDDFRNDVWSSGDGKQWIQMVKHAPWAARRGHGAVVFKDRLWVIGGSLSSGRRDAVPTQSLNDVWSSSDGITWQQVTQHAPWIGRECGTTLVYNNRLWIIGGPNTREVWSSADGREWRQETANAAFGPREAAAGAVFDGKIWVYGGVEKNDVWYSTDGKTWTQAFAEAPWSTRSTTYSTVYKGRLLLFSGKTGRADTQMGEIWAMSRRAE